jgi:hypothetical protein
MVKNLFFTFALAAFISIVNFCEHTRRQALTRKPHRPLPLRDARQSARLYEDALNYTQRKFAELSAKGCHMNLNSPRRLSVSKRTSRTLGDATRCSCAAGTRPVLSGMLHDLAGNADQSL